jgi:nucleotide-binding universal stress UspA family protein
MKDWDIKTIVLGYDGSEGADRAFRLASAVAHQNNARIFVVTAFHGDHADGLGEKASLEIGTAQETAREVALKLRAAGIEAEPEALEGPAGDALLRVAETREADLVVVGRRGHGFVAGLLLGSTSEYVVRQAKVPVLVAE